MLFQWHLSCGAFATARILIRPQVDFFLFDISFLEFMLQTGLVIIGGGMEKEDAIAVMSHLAGKLEDVLAIEDVVSPYAEFLVHIRTSISEEDFAFLATIGAMIYLKGFREYDACLKTGLLMEK